MFPFIDRLNAFAAVGADLLWAIVWQSTLVALVVAAVCWGLRRSSPAVRYWLWQVVAIKLLLMPFWTLAVPLPFAPAKISHSAVAQSVPNAPSVRDTASDMPLILLDSTETEFVLVSQESLQPASSTATPPATAWWQTTGLNRIHLTTWLMLAWVLAVVWRMLRLFHQHRRLHKLLRDALVNEIDPRCVSLLREAAIQLGLAAIPGVRFTEVEGSPFVCGILKPLLVMPRALWTRLDEAQLRQVLLHELAHIQRRDLLWGWIPELARVVYFFHPVAHGVSARIRLERELACDQAAMTVGRHTPADYAATLVQVVSHVSQPICGSS